MSARTPKPPHRIVVTEANEIDPELAVETLRELWQAARARKAAAQEAAGPEAAPQQAAA